MIKAKRYNKFYLLIFFPLILISIVFNTQAKQLSFSKQEDGTNYKFNYQWLDYHNQKQDISFHLPKKALFDRFRDFKTYKPLPAQKFIYREVNKQLKNKPLEAVQVQFIKKEGSYTIRITGRNPEKIDQARKAIKQLEAKAEKKYFTKHFYHLFTNHEKMEGIKPDHVRIGNSSVADFKSIKPLILEKVSIKNIRKATNYILGFVQSIPYSPLESRVTSSGAGFNPPLKLLWENQGDCDSKVTLTAAMLRALMPRIEMVLVYIDQHAFIGIAVQPLADEITIFENNITYVLAEPTGPAILGLGKLAPDSEQAILSGHYTTEVF